MSSDWDPKRLANRYQNQPWYIKLWRRRWYLLRPYWAIKWWLADKDLWLRDAWSIACGWSHHEMEWWYTWEETDARIRKVLDDD